MIVGLTGKYAAGKGTVAELLVERGFGYHSLSDVLRAELRRRGVPESREALLALGNELRGKHGPGALAELIGPELAGGPDHIVDSIRNPAEVTALRKLDGFVLLGIDADPRVRFERLTARGRQGDPTTWDAFRALEDKETRSENPAAQQLAATYDCADAVLMNDGSREDLTRAVLGWLASAGG
jgi:dCMP deaminase